MWNRHQAQDREVVSSVQELQDFPGCGLYSESDEIQRLCVPSIALFTASSCSILPGPHVTLKLLLQPVP